MFRQTGILNSIYMGGSQRWGEGGSGPLSLKITSGNTGFLRNYYTDHPQEAIGPKGLLLKGGPHDPL